MGIAFVLLFWVVILGGVAAVLAGVFGMWSFTNHRRQRRGRLAKPLMAAAFPFLALGYAGLAFLGYAIWCKVFRGVDPGIGDGWQVPIANSVYFCMIDDTDDGYLLEGGA